jgi:curved DNA-binding protein CbpA
VSYWCTYRSSPITKILAQIMTKLNESVEKNCAALEGNPLLALKCSKSDITQKDVKKAYRTMILKYHPDKNQDCDTSCIFTAIQSAYERLVNAPPKSSEPEEGNGGSMHSSFFKGKEGESNPRSSSNQRRTQHHAPPPSQQRQKRAAPHPPREEDYYSKAGGSSGRKTSHSGDVYGMTSEQIRRALRALGGSGRRGGQQQAKNEKELNGCSREELVRRYLNARARAFSTGCNEAQWQQKLTEMIRRERKRERDAEEQKAKEWAQKQEQARQPTSSTARPRTGNNNKHQEKSAAEADKADQHRQERVARMKKELPLMSITELRRMMNTW